MPYLIIAITILLLVFGPQLYVRHVMRRYGRDDPHLPGTGGELARHLLARHQLTHILVEETERGDHYDPQRHRVCLSRDNLQGRSLTAVAVAAHEVGHALQHQQGYPMFEVRTRMIRVARVAQRLGAGAMLAAPVLTILSKAPPIGVLTLLLAVVSFFSATLVHLVTLPVEWDASFGRALPILTQGRYITAREERAVRRILRAAALTYVAASLASTLNLARWLTLLRR